MTGLERAAGTQGFHPKGTRATLFLFKILLCFLDSCQHYKLKVKLKKTSSNAKGGMIARGLPLGDRVFPFGLRA